MKMCYLYSFVFIHIHSNTDISVIGWQIFILKTICVNCTENDYTQDRNIEGMFDNIINFTPSKFDVNTFMFTN